MLSSKILRKVRNAFIPNCYYLAVDIIIKAIISVACHLKYLDAIFSVLFSMNLCLFLLHIVYI